MTMRAGIKKSKKGKCSTRNAYLIKKLTKDFVRNSTFLENQIDNMINHGQSIYSLELVDGKITRTDIPLNDFFVQDY